MLTRFLNFALEQHQNLRDQIKLNYLGCSFFLKINLPSNIKEKKILGIFSAFLIKALILNQ